VERRIFESEHETFRNTARRFFEQDIAPSAAQWREQGFVDPVAFRKAGQHGFLLMWADERYGGAGVSDFRYEQILIEENMRRGEPGFYLTLHSRLVAPYIGQLGNEAQKARFLPACARGEIILGIAMTEPDAGSDLAGMRSTARDCGDCWLLNGTKTYISNGQIGDLFVVAARTVPGERHGLGLFLVEAGMPGFTRGRNLRKMGLKAQDTSELFFNDVRVPKENVLGDPTRGFHHLRRFLAEERLIGSCMYVSHAQEAFDLTLEFITNRRVFGRPLGAFQNARFKMARMRAQIDAIQAFVDHCVMEQNTGRLTGDLAAEAKLLASELEGQVMDECVQLHGGAGYMEEYRICRMFTDARVSRIYAGSSEIMQEIIARAIGLDERKMK
jgi:acyl-CoA dehydrogenase